MSEIQVIETTLQKTVRRRRWQNAWRGFWTGLLVGAGLWLTALLIYKLFPVPAETLTYAGVAGGVCLVVGFFLGWFQRLSLLETARWIDRKEGLQERLSTALEVSKTQNAGRWRDLILADAASVVAKIEPKKLLPYQLPRATRWVFAVLFLSAVLGFVPEYRSKAYVQKKKEEEVIRETGKQLAELTRRSLAQRPPALEPTRNSLDSVVELGDMLSKAKLTRNDALKDLASVTDKLKEQAKELGRNPAIKSLEKMARNYNRSGTPSSAEMQKQMESLQKSLGDQPGDPQALERLKKDLQKAKQSAAGMADKNSGAGETDRDQLGQMLSDLARQAKDLGVSLPSLEEAMEALASSRPDQLLRDLNIAETELEKLQAMAEALKQLQMQMDKIGKDLAEQLEKGQAQEAQQTLAEMIRKLKEGELSKEDLEKMMSDVSKAINPAGEYGKAAEFLKKADAQMKTGQKSDAAQSLADAAKELEGMLAELADADALMASIASLQKAQMCIGNCQSWGQNPGSGPPRAGKGGGVGSGVGTWADDSNWLDVSQIKDRWDNSGVVRSDEDARGHTDRGDGELADSLAPTKIKGKINPGGAMPSITMKGVSIKGMSRVDFEEMAAAAQSDAQGALSQDQVPRAYQGAVRDYFDDLKK